ncbi:hypothetical protein [Streptomyces sp. KL116D]|uniref:hypothetical protein n=1 Tax=Streptomyces sp. KL116D TaxID=3045152 RepID=UPI00355884F2
MPTWQAADGRRHALPRQRPVRQQRHRLRPGHRQGRRSRASKAFRQPRVIAADGKQVYVIAGILEKDFTSQRNVIAALDARSGRDVAGTA